MPSAPVWRATETFVPSLVTVTVAPGIKAPLGSATVPVNVPVETCPRAVGSVQHTSVTTAKRTSHHEHVLDFDLDITTPFFALGVEIWEKQSEAGMAEPPGHQVRMHCKD